MRGLKKIAWGGNIPIYIYMDIVTTRPKRPKGQFGENPAYMRNWISRQVRIVAPTWFFSDLIFFNEKKILSVVMCQVSCFACHLSPVPCYLSPVTCHMSLPKYAQQGAASDLDIDPSMRSRTDPTNSFFWAKIENSETNVLKADSVKSEGATTVSTGYVSNTNE